MGVTFIILLAALAYSLLGLPQTVLKPSVRWSSGAAFRGVCCALALFLLVVSWRTYLSRFPFLWDDHPIFSGVTYTEAHYTLPALLFVCVALIISAIILLVNAFAVRRFSLLLIALAIPVTVYVIGVVLVPSYIQSFIVKPNELDRESPYIGHNIEWTRRGFGLDQIEQREFEAENSIAALDCQTIATASKTFASGTGGHYKTRCAKSRTSALTTISRCRRRSLRTGGQTRQMMIAPREIDDVKLPIIVAQLDQRETDLYARLRRDDEHRQRLYARRPAAICVVEHAG